jgi:hypothetical protein
VLLHRWHLKTPSVPSGTVRIRHRGPHFFFPVRKVSQKSRTTTNRTRRTQYLPQAYIHVVLFDRYHGLHSSCYFLFTPNLPARPHNDYATPTTGVRSDHTTTHSAGSRRRFGRHAATRGANTNGQCQRNCSEVTRVLACVSAHMIPPSRGRFPLLQRHCFLYQV